MSGLVLLTRGLPASGKTTWAKEYLAATPGAAKRISKDDLRAMLDDGRHSKANERFVLALRDAAILAALDAGCTALVDDTNLDPRHLESIIQLVHGRAEVEVEVIDFPTPLAECIERDRKRMHPVGERVIRQMYRQYLRPAPRPEPPVDTSLPEAIICDLDGTLALFTGNPYDRDFASDTPNRPVTAILARMQLPVLLTSGRSEKFRAVTEQWLHAHQVSYELLLMRPEHDNRKDVLLKREMYEQSIHGHYRVLFVLDDRDQVVEGWRALGLSCLQVAEGDF